MKKLNQPKLKILSLLSFILSLIPFSIFILWIRVFNIGTTQIERVTLFNEYFPYFLNGRWDTTLLGIAFCVLAIFLSVTSLKLPGKFWKTLNIIILVLSSLLLLLNLFSML
jgi:hypothetical protein